ncbi:MAG: T9SS type A sorting domain-containing protein [bacterium]
MKKNLFTIIILLIISTCYAFSQFEIRNLPYFMDQAWHNKPKDYVRTAHLKPYPMPAYAEKLKPGPAKIQSKSGIELINISEASSHQSETFITINPLNPNNIVVGSNDYRYNGQGSGYRMVAFYSTDAGNTWNESTTPSNLNLGLITYPQGGGCTNVDPGIGFDSQGNVYYVYLFAQLMDDGSAGDNGVFVCKSLDGGKTWPSNNVGVPVLNYNKELQDKCFIAVDSDPNSPYKNRSYVVWYDTKYPYAIGFAYAEDGLLYNSATSVTGSAGKSVQSPLPIVGPNGVLYVTWEEKVENGTKTRAVVQKSTNGGISWAWSTPKTAQVVNTSGTKVGSRMAFPDKGDMRISSHPSMDVDLRNGNLYLVQGGKDELNKYGVYLSKSTDGGETWSASSSQVADLFKIDGNTIGNDVFLPSIAIDPVTGMIAVLYYSSENDPDNNKGCDAFLAISFDEGATFNHIQMTDTWIFQYNSVWDAGGDNLGRYWGDYTSIDIYNGKIYPCFWMPTAANTDFWSCDLFTANLSTAPVPPSNLVYENSAETPTKVVLLWDDPSKNQLGGPLGDFKIFAYRNWEKIGEVNKGEQKFTDNSATNGETYTYAIKAVQTNGEESDFVTITITAGGVMEAKLPSDIAPKPRENGIFVTWTNPVEHIDNSYLYDLYAVDIYIDGTLEATVQAPQIQAGEGSSILIEMETGKFYKLKLKIRTKRGENIAESAFSDEIICYSGSPFSILDENFDNPDNMIASYTEGTWATTNKAAYSTPNSLTDSPDGDYPLNSINQIILAPVIVKQGEATLQITHIALIAKKDDYAKIKVSKDFGNTYESIAWLNVNRYSGWDASGFNVANSEWFIDGFDFAEFEGDTIYIMFELSSVPLTSKDGWYIDDVKLGDFPVSVKESSNWNATLSPNPLQNNAELSFSLPNSGNINISIYNQIGQELSDILNTQLNPGEVKIPIDFSSYSNGFYFLRINLNGTNEVIPFIIEK